MIKLKEIFFELSKSKKNFILIICAVLAILLLVVSEFTSSANDSSKENANGYISSENYIKEQESKLTELLETSSIVFVWISSGLYVRTIIFASFSSIRMPSAK